MSSSPITGPGLPSGLSVYSAGASGDFDYPSPIDTPGERRMSGYFPPFDMEMKEN